MPLMLEVNCHQTSTGQTSGRKQYGELLVEPSPVLRLLTCVCPADNDSVMMAQLISYIKLINQV